MEFANARKGIKRIYAAEILSLLELLISFIAGTIQRAGEGGSILDGGTINLKYDSPVLLGLAVALVVCGFLSFILHLLGITKAAKDEPKFSSALLWVVLGIIIGSVKSSLTLNEPLPTILSIADNIAEMLVKFFIIKGVISVAQQMNRPGLGMLGGKALTWTVLAYIVSIALNGAVLWFTMKGDPTGADALPVEAILLAAAFILSLIAYVIYLRFLKKATQSLG